MSLVPKLLKDSFGPQKSRAAPARKTANGDGRLFAAARRLRHRLAAYWEQIQATYWFVPAVLTVLAIGLAFATVRLDHRLQVDRIVFLDWVYARGPDGARAVLSTVAGSMITVAGVVFSVTVVALSLASNQFGPRLLRNFMRDRGNQIVLGAFVATFVYCLLVLRTVKGVEDSEFVPHLSVTVAILLSMASIGVLIYFIHHLSVSVQAPEVVAHVAIDLRQAIHRLFPEDVGDAVKSDEDEGGLAADFESGGRTVRSASGGYVQAVDAEGLLALATEHDLVVRLRRRPGLFVVEGNPLFEAWPRDRVDDDIAEKIRETFLLGSQQTPFQDVEFVFNQLVEIAVRALSPGVNDPFTALACLDRLGEGLCLLADRKIPSACRRDGEGRIRVVAEPITFPAMADVAFGQIRHYGRSSVVILLRLLEVLALILGRTRREGDRVAIIRQVLLTKDAAVGLMDVDRAAVEASAQKLFDAAGR